MRRGRRPCALPACGLALLAMLWGLCWLLQAQPEPVRVEAVMLGSEDGEGSPVVFLDRAAQGGMAFRNLGQSGCRLRVRVCVDKIEGKPVLEVGRQTSAGFLAVGVGEEKSAEYWTARGEYIYYENEGTGGLLLPGRQTPALYTAVRLNRALAGEELEAARRLGGEQSVFVVVEAEAGQEETGGDWDGLELSGGHWDLCAGSGGGLWQLGGAAVPAAKP